MASYWVSQERYFCKYCKVWLSNHQASIRNHDQGKKHVAIVEEYFRKKREDKLKGAESESDLKRQMERIEKAALKAHEKDIGAFGGGASSVSSSAQGASDIPPPPPPPPPGDPPPRDAFHSDEEVPPPPPPPGPGRVPSTHYGDVPPPPPPPRQPQRGLAEPGSSGAGALGAGVVADGGSWYLDGQVHQDKLAVDTPCQIFLTAEGQWVDAMVLGITPLADGAAHTGSTRRLSVAYFEAGAEKETVVHGVEASAVRILAGEGGAWPPPPSERDDVPPPPPPPPPDENTGLGGWQTVSVRVVDEAAEAEARRLKKEAKKERKLKREEKSEREKMLLEAMDADDAMGSYDPWGTGKYKGFDIKKEEPRAGVGADGGDDKAGGNGAEAPVAFKKRRGVGNKGKFRKKPREGDD